MAIITLTKKEKIGRIIKLTPVQFEIPDKIVCPQDGEVMSYQAWDDAYVCSVCKEKIKSMDFIKAEIEKENQNMFTK